MLQRDGTTSSFFLPTVASAVALPSAGLACQVHCLHLKLGWGFRGLGMPLPFLRTQLEQPTEKMEFVLTPLRHMVPGFLPDFRNTSRPSPDIRTLVLPTSKSLSVHVSLPVDQLLVQFLQRFSDDNQVILIQLSKGHPVWNSWERASRTVKNSKVSGKSLDEHPLTLNFSLRLQPTRTLLLAFS